MPPKNSSSKSKSRKGALTDADRKRLVSGRLTKKEEKILKQMKAALIAARRRRSSSLIGSPKRRSSSRKRSPGSRGGSA